MSEKEKPCGIPAELRERRIWLKTGYSGADEDGKPQYKKPVGKGGGWKDSARWFTYEEACKSEHGCGIALDDLLCLDFDKVLHMPGDLSSMSADALDVFENVRRIAGGTYTETSTSGAGLHMIYRAEEVPSAWKSKGVIPLAGKGEHVDVLCKRFFVKLTGRVMGDVHTVAPAPPALLAYLSERIGKTAAPETQAPPAATAPSASSAAPPAARMKGCKVLTAEEVPDVIRNSKSGALFSQLFDYGRVDGDVKAYPSESEADAALLLLLAPYCGETGGDVGMMEEVFSMSARAATLPTRKKGHERDYIKRSIEAALKKWDGWYYGKPKPGANVPIEIVFPIMETVGKVIRPMPDVWQNTKALLDALHVSCRYNIMSKDTEVRGTLPDGAKLDGMSGDALIPALFAVARVNGLRVKKSDLADNLLLIAEKNRYSPPCEYLSSCHSAYMDMSKIDDLPDYIGMMFARFVFNPAFDIDVEFARLLFEKWLIGAARIAFNTGRETMQGVLVLQGAGGIGKSRFLYSLVPEGAGDWVKGETSLDPTDKDSKLQATKYWLVEISEFNGTMKREKQDALKQFWTDAADEIRVPYGKKSEKRPRITAYYGTSNDVGILKDMTGNRRYWILPLLEIKPLPESFDLTMFWGEVMHKAFDLKEPSYLNRDEIDKLEGQNELFESVSDEEQAILDSHDMYAPPTKEGGWSYRTKREIGEESGIKGRLSRVGAALRHIAKRYKGVKLPTNHMDRRVWFAPEKSEFFMTE